MSARAKLAETQRENSQLRVKLNELTKELTDKNIMINNLMTKLSQLRKQYEPPGSGFNPVKGDVE